MDPSTARTLPDEFLNSTGTSIERTLSLVLRHWRSYPIGEQRQLAQALVSLLDPLLRQPSSTVSDALRDDCFRTIKLWEERKDRPVSVDRRRLSARPARAVKFLRSMLERFPDDHCRARVELERGAGGPHVGMAEGPYGVNETVRCVAEATTHAIHQAFAFASDTLVVQDVTLRDLFGKQAVFVEVAANHGGTRRQLLGFCPIGEDPIRAASLAVLNATNRFLELS
jgi:hypothetical protein